MIELMRRIGFPPFKRSKKASASRSHARMTHQVFAAEPLEAKMLLAADVFSSGGAESAHVVPMEAFSILHALSRGRDQMLSFSTTTDSASNNGALNPVEAPPVVTPPKVSNEAPSAPAVDLVVSEPVASVPAGSKSGVLSVQSVAEGEAGDVEITIGDGIFVIYNSNTGVLRLDTGTPVTSLEIVSESGIFTGSAAANLGGTFDVDTDVKIFKLTSEFSSTGAPIGFNSLSFGAVAQTGLTEEFIRNDITISGSPQPSGVLSNKQVKVEVFATNLTGTRINQIAFGEEFLLQATVKDVRPTSFQTDGNLGVFAAYFDVTWDAALAEAVGTPAFSSSFSNATSGTVGQGILDEVGAVSTVTSPTSTDTFTLFTQRMRAKSAGTLEFTLDPADQLPQHEVLVFGGTSAVEVYEMNFDDDASVVVTDTPTAPDLVAFAKALTAEGAIMYGAGWCPHCTATKELFQDGQEFLNFVEVTNPDRTPNQIAIDNNIESYPTWVFSDGTRLVGEQTLEAIADAAGIEIPESNSPTIIGLEDVDVLGGSPLHVPLDGYDPNGGELTYVVTTDNPSLLTPTVLSGNRSMQIDVAGFGKMVLELFDQEAPRATNQIASLAEDGFYDGITFHRILDGFVIQGGDPEGDGTGGSDLPDFDDQFDVDLTHNQKGVLSMAKGADDTNNSQFFITDAATRWLDFNHTIFGQLVEGEKNLDSISATEVESGGVPTRPVVMNSVTIFQDVENGLLRLSAPEGASGSANVTVTVMDAEGHEFSQTFAVTVSPDDQNGGPFLEDIPELSTPQNTTLNYQLTAIDAEGDDVMFVATTSDDNITISVDENTGELEIVPADGFVGTATATVGVTYAVDSDTQDRYDTQRITISVLPGSPTIDLVDASDTGSSSSDNVTNAVNLDFEVTGVADGATVTILADGSVVGTGTATGNSITITVGNIATMGDGTYSVTAVQTFDGQDSAPSTPISLTLDQTAPTDFLSTAPTTAVSQSPLTYDVDHSEEGDTGFSYSLLNAPTGATINADTGVVNWTPTISQVGTNAFGIVATDAAGNTATQNVSINVESNQVMGVRIEIVDESGNPIEAVATGQEFTLRVYVEDLRPESTSESRGVFAAYVDVNYDAAMADVSGNISYGASFGNGQFGDTNTDGLINDVGANAGTTPLGSGEFLLFSVPMIGTSAGTLNFTTDGADELPLLESTISGLDTGLTSDQIVFGTTSIEVVAMTFAVKDEFQTLEDSTDVALRVLDNDIPVPSTTTLTITDVSTPSNGTVTIVNDGELLRYTPNANFQGIDTFTYTITDGNGETATANVTVEVVNVNDNPVATDDSFTIAEDSGEATLNVLANDNSGVDPTETLQISSVSDPSNGTVSISNDGLSLLYTPDANFSGTETITYLLSDGNGGTATANVTITVTEVNDAPTATRDIRSMNEDSQLTINISDLLGNDSAGEDGQTLSFVSLGTPTAGSASRSGDTITFTPPADFFGTVAIEYTIQDDGTTNGVADPKTAVGTITINIANVNDDPTAMDDTGVVQSSAGSIKLDVVANDLFTPDANETLSITAVTQGSAGGQISITNDNQVEYQPAQDFSGVETFTYTISDGNGGTATATVSVTVQSFVPGGVSGYLFFDSNGDGVLNEREIPLSNSLVRISGTAANGDAFAKTVQSNSVGYYSFDAIPPGNYMIEKVMPSFTVGSRQVVSGGTGSNISVLEGAFSVDLSTDGTNGASLNFTELDLEPKFAIWEALASSSDIGFYAAVDSAEGMQWTRMDNGWNGTTVQNVRMNASETAIVITVVENGATMRAVVPRTDRKRVQIIGQDGSASLIRIRGGRSDFNFEVVTS